MKKSATVFIFSALASLSALAQNIQEGINDLYAERYQGAKSVFEKLLAAKPNNVEASYWLGQADIASKDIAGAKAVYDKALAVTNNAPLILVGEGHVELLQGKPNDAKQHFESAINASHGRKGNDPAVLDAVGHAIVESYSEENKTDLDYAIAKLNEAAQLQSNNPDIYLNLGNAYRKKREGGNAVQAYNKAGNFAPALYRIGMIYESQRSLRDPNDWDIVLDYYNRAVAADPNFAPAYLRLYNYYLFAKKDFATAETYANKYVGSSDPGVENTYLQAQTKFVQNQFTDAINIGKNIIAQTNGNPNPRVYRMLSYSYMGNKDTATACEYANQFFVKETNQDEIVAADYLMHAQACGKNNPDVIQADIAKAIQIDPENAPRVLREAIDDARKAEQRGLEGELGLMLYKLQGEKANPQNLVALGIPFYQAGDLPKADSLFQAYSKNYPDSIYGYLWDARVLSQMDTAMTQGLAMPAYEQLLRVAKMDTTRFKSYGIQAATNLAIYYVNVKNDKEKGIYYLEEGLALDPNNQSFKSNIEKLKKASGSQQRSSTSSNAAKTETKTKVKGKEK